MNIRSKNNYVMGKLFMIMAFIGL